MEVHLRDVRYFVAVADELSVARAAERLYVSQPAVSKQLRALERRLGFTLFERRPEGITLTPEGVALRDRARDMLSEWEDAVETARGAGQRTIVIGLQTAIGHGLTRALHSSLGGCDWHLVLRVVPWSDPTAGLVNGSSHAAVLWEPVAGPLVSRPLASERRCVAVPVGHRLADRDLVTFEEIAAEPLIALPSSAGPGRPFWLAEDQRQGQPAPIAAEATSPTHLFDLVARGAGLALVAECHAPTCAPAGVQVVPIADLTPARLRLAWRPGDSGSALNTLIEHIEDLSA